MCVVSMISDHFHDKWNDFYKYTSPPVPEAPLPPWLNPPVPPSTTPTLTEEEVAELRKLLDRAREYDERNGEPDCELEEKKERLRKLAEELGAAITFPE